MSKKANLQVCASCTWIFRLSDSKGCPKCDFASYGARWALGNKCYRYEKTQEPWLERKLEKYHMKLLEEIRSAQQSLHADLGEASQVISFYQDQVARAGGVPKDKLRPSA